MEQAKLEESFHWFLSSQGGKQGWEQLLVVMSRLPSKVKSLFWGALVAWREHDLLRHPFVFADLALQNKWHKIQMAWVNLSLVPGAWISCSKDIQSDWTLQMKKRGFSRAPRNLNLRLDDWAGGPRHSQNSEHTIPDSFSSWTPREWGIRIHGFIQWTHQSPAEVHGSGIGSSYSWVVQGVGHTVYPKDRLYYSLYSYKRRVPCLMSTNAQIRGILGVCHSPWIGIPFSWFKRILQMKENLKKEFAKGFFFKLSMMAAERLGKSLAKVQGRMLAEILENAGTAQLATMLLHQWWDSPFSEPAASRFGTGAVFGVELRTFDDVLWNCRSCVASFSRTACHQGLMSSSPLLTSGACRRQWQSGRFCLQEEGGRQVGLELGGA